MAYHCEHLIEHLVWQARSASARRPRHIEATGGRRPSRGANWQDLPSIEGSQALMPGPAVAARGRSSPARARSAAQDGVAGVNETSVMSENFLSLSKICLAFLSFEMLPALRLRGFFDQKPPMKRLSRLKRGSPAGRIMSEIDIREIFADKRRRGESCRCDRLLKQL